jgi:hypothetical protein
MAVNNAALGAVAANAMRHLIEADQHYKARRYPSATASAVLSIEETGKLAFFMFTGSPPKGKGHAKHAMHTVLFVALLKTVSSFGWSNDWRQILREGNTPDAALTAQQKQTIADHPEVADFVRRVRAGELDDSKERLNAWAAAMTAKEQRDGTFKRWLPLITGGLQPLRLRATYVDVADSGDSWSGPDLNDSETPEILCAGALGLLGLMLAGASSIRETLDVRDLIESMPDDLTGLAVLRAAFPGFGAAAASPAKEAS